MHPETTYTHRQCLATEYLKFDPSNFWIKWTDPSGKRYCRTVILQLLKKERQIIEKAELDAIKGGDQLIDFTYVKGGVTRTIQNPAAILRRLTMEGSSAPGFQKH